MREELFPHQKRFSFGELSIRLKLVTLLPQPFECGPRTVFGFSGKNHDMRVIDEYHL